MNRFSTLPAIAAALFLSAGGGYAMAAVAPLGTSISVDPCFWQTAHWSTLDAKQRDLLGRLGWNATKWESGNPDDYPPTDGKSWIELTDQERQINESLGETEQSWDNPPDNCPAR